MIDPHIQEKLHSINSAHLPVLPAGIPELLGALNNETITFTKLSEEIERFPTIAARLIVVANSVWSSPIKPINSLAEACARLGISIVKSISMALAIASTFNLQRCPTFDVPRFWCRSLLVADIASSLAEVSGQHENAGIARTAGLLHNLGLLWLADQLPNEINALLIEHNKDPESCLDQVLSKGLSFDHAQAGAFLGHQWGLPDSLVTALKLHLIPEDFVDEGGSANILGHAVMIAKAAEANKVELMPKTLKSALNISSFIVDDQFKQTLVLLKKNRELAQTLF